MGVYNAAETLSAAIESVLAQTFEDWEMIICDDCSTDNTQEVVSRYTNKFPQIKLIRNETNKRLAYSLNYCLEYAQGEYIARMDADDMCLPNRLKKQVEFLDSHPEYQVVGGGVQLFDGKVVKLSLIHI